MKTLDYMQETEIAQCIGWPCLSETSGSLFSYLFYVINGNVLLQIPKTNCDEKLTCEEFKYAPVT